MADIETTRQHRLIELSENDEVFKVWKHSHDLFFAQFYAYASAQSADIQDFLFGYAESGKLMYQRMVNLACKYMAFIEKTENGT